MDVSSIRLTELSSCAGCAAKLGAAELRSVMERVAPATNDRVLVGYGTSDDAGVYPPPAVMRTLVPERAKSMQFMRLLTRAWTDFKTGG